MLKLGQPAGNMFSTLIKLVSFFRNFSVRAQLAREQDSARNISRVSALKLKNVKALGFCVDSTFAISRTEITSL